MLSMIKENRALIHIPCYCTVWFYTSNATDILHNMCSQQCLSVIWIIHFTEILQEKRNKAFFSSHDNGHPSFIWQNLFSLFINGCLQSVQKQTNSPIFQIEQVSCKFFPFKYKGFSIWISCTRNSGWIWWNNVSHQLCL